MLKRILGYRLGVRYLGAPGVEQDYGQGRQPLLTLTHNAEGEAVRNPSQAELMFCGDESVPPQRAFAEEDLDLAIVGAGPVGLSLAAHAAANELKALTLGEPLAFWSRHILSLPLRSPPATTNIDTPVQSYTYAGGVVVLLLPGTGNLARLSTWDVSRHPIFGNNKITTLP